MADKNEWQGPEFLIYFMLTNNVKFTPLLF